MLRGDLEGVDLDKYVEERVLTTTLDRAVDWARGNSLFPLTFGLACCAIEMMSIVGARLDIARFGFEAFRASPRQADLLILSGRVSHQDGADRPAHLRPDARAEVRDRDGRLLVVDGRLQQLRDRAGRQVHAGRRARAGLPAAARGADARHHQAALDGPARPEHGLARSATAARAPRRSSRVPDATGLELLARELCASATPTASSTPSSSAARRRSSPRRSRSSRRSRPCASAAIAFLASVHGVDYYPQEPRLGVHYELLDMDALDRVAREAARPGRRAATSPSVTPQWPTAEPPGARGLRHVRRRLRRPPGPAPHPHARGLRGPSAAPRLPDRRRAGALHAQRDRRRRGGSPDDARTDRRVSSDYRRHGGERHALPSSAIVEPTGRPASC